MRVFFHDNDRVDNFHDDSIGELLAILSVIIDADRHPLELNLSVCSEVSIAHHLGVLHRFRYSDVDLKQNLLGFRFGIRDDLSLFCGHDITQRNDHRVRNCVHDR